MVRIHLKTKIQSSIQFLKSSYSNSQTSQVSSAVSEFRLTSNLKTYFEYILFGQPHYYLRYKLQWTKITCVMFPQPLLYFVAFHTRFSSLFYSSQLVDMFAYELPRFFSQNQNFFSNSVVVYNFHNLQNHERFFLFTTKTNNFKSQNNLYSVDCLYPNSSWLEREVSELHGIVFNGKKDLRNLMLQYGDTSAPFQKAYPSIGTKEVFYDSNNDLIVQLPISLQV